VNKYLDLAPALFALAAAFFWFQASGKLPPMLTYWDHVPASDPYRQAIEHSAWLNSVASFLSGCAALSRSKLLRTICVAVVLTLVPFAAAATMPRLDEMPPVRTDGACWAWAGKQIYHEDVAIMWGILDDGNYDPAVAVRRLADVCVGKEQPEIVGVGSSAGYYRVYCQNHPRQKICLIKNMKAQCVGNPDLCAQVCERGGWCP